MKAEITIQRVSYQNDADDADRQNHVWLVELSHEAAPRIEMASGDSPGEAFEAALLQLAFTLRGK